MERSAGIVRLEHVTVDHLAAVIENLQNDDRAAALWREAATSNPATWRDFALATAEWLNGTGVTPQRRVLRGSIPTRPSTSTRPMATFGFWYRRLDFSYI